MNKEAVLIPLRRRWPLVILVLVSLGYCLFVMTFHDAVGATPWETTDSVGRTMGFKDRFSEEHFGIILGNCSLWRTLATLSVYEGVLIAAHALMLGLLMGYSGDRWIFWPALAQPLIFPLGVPCLIVLPVFIFGFVTRDVGDREGFIDIPYVAFTAHPMWVLVSMIIAWCAFRAGRKRRREARQG